VLAQPELYISEVEQLLDDQGELTNADSLRHLGQFLQAFVAQL